MKAEPKKSEIIIQRELVCKMQPQKPHNNKHNIDTANPAT